MAMWDMNMQTDCSKAFQCDEIINSLSSENREMLLMQIIEIFNLTDFQLYERFVNEWMQVFEKLMPLLDISFANLTLVPHLKGLTSHKSNLQDRLNGFRILCLVIRYHLKAFESEPTYKRLLQQMGSDRHWRVRK